MGKITWQNTHVVQTLKLNTTYKGAILVDISDHLPIFYVEEIEGIQLGGKKEPIYKRKINEESIANFRAKLTEKDFDNIYRMSNTQDAFTSFRKTINDFFDESFPLKKFTPGYTNKKPWLKKSLSIINIAWASPQVGGPPTQTDLVCSIL